MAFEGNLVGPIGPQRPNYGGGAEAEQIDPFFKSTEDLQSAFKKTSRQDEKRIAADREMFLGQLGTDEDDERLSERDLALAGGDIRRHADAAANESIASTSRRLGGDTSSPLFQLIATGARGGAAGATGAAKARFRLEDAQSLKDRSIQRAELMLGMQRNEAARRGQTLQNQAFLHDIFQTDRTFQNTLDQQQTQKQMFALQNAYSFASPFGGNPEPGRVSEFLN
jgi:hypothetical protein